MDPLMPHEGPLKFSPFIMKERGRKFTKCKFKGDIRTTEKI
jgi:hypothetical protein